MKKFLFDSIAGVTYGLIWATDRLFSVPLAVFAFMHGAHRVTIARTGFFFMKVIDPIQCKLAEAITDSEDVEAQDELSTQSMELQLMESSYKVRDHAKQLGDWTDQHTEAIEAIGNALLLEVGWDEESVEHHMRSVVESIDGLQMDSWFEDED